MYRFFSKLPLRKFFTMPPCPEPAELAPLLTELEALKKDFCALPNADKILLNTSPCKNASYEKHAKDILSKFTSNMGQLSLSLRHIAIDHIVSLPHADLKDNELKYLFTKLYLARASILEIMATDHIGAMEDYKSALKLDPTGETIKKVESEQEALLTQLRANLES